MAIVYCGLFGSMNIQFSGDYWVCLMAFCAIACMVVFVQTGIRNAWFNMFSGRKILHASAIGICAAVIHLVSDRSLLSAAFLISFVVLFFVAHRQLLFRGERVSYGIAFFTLSFALQLMLDFPSEAIVYGAVVLALCDPAAGITGMYFGRKQHLFLFEEKTWAGFLGFYVSCLVVSVAFTGWHVGVFILALIPAMAELYSWRGSDNFTVPFLGAVWFMVMAKQSWHFEMYGWLAIFSIIMYVVVRKRWLTPQAVPAAVVLAAVLFWAGSWRWLVVMLIFFVCGSLSSKWVPSTGDAGGRNAKQVLANGGIAGLCALGYFIFPDTSWIFAFLTSVAISMSDTLSSDLGILVGQQPVDIIKRTPVTKGMSGGITWYGTLAGAGGALIIAVTGGFLFSLTSGQMLWIGLMGFAGMLTDSILGSLYQAKYRDGSGQIHEIAEEGLTLFKGKSFITNDVVNLIANAGVTMLTFIFAFALAIQ
jgi:uncharacterized protein (TIGR00297 family)